MQGKRHESEPACGCDRTDLRCAALTVRQLSQDRVHGLAEEIWTRSTGGRLPASPIPDPRRSRPGASAFAAYRRYRQLERAAWRPGWRWRAPAAGAAAVTAGALIGRSLGPWLGWWIALLVALLTGWRLRFRPSAAVARGWRRRARMQRRSAGVLVALERDGYLVLHDVTLPGWPASLDHLVVGWTGVWVIRSWQPSWPAALRRAIASRRAHGTSAGMARGLPEEAVAVADALAGATMLPVRALLCAHGWPWPAADWSVQQVQVVTPRRLADAIRGGPRVRRGEVEQAAARALEVLRPAA